MAQSNKRHIDLPQLAADEPTVRELLEDLRVAYENVLNAYPDKHENKTIRYVDAMMAVHNLHRLAIQHVIEEAGMPIVDAMGYMRIMRDTFTRGMDRDIEQLRRKAEGVRRPRGH